MTLSGEDYKDGLEMLFKRGELRDGDILVLSRGEDDPNPVRLLFKHTVTGEIDLVRRGGERRVYATYVMEGDALKVTVTKSEALE